jgi:methylated-DNA-protein-cysteine methyltransferase related protein
VVSSGRRREPNGAFADRVVRVVARTAPGEVVTYGEVAAEAGRAGAARAVGRVLRDTDVALPWWRVVTVTGRLVPGLEAEHADRLEAEGVAVDRDRGRVARRRGPAGQV